jgi:peptidoglycan biosynthesis protein MviN/MurJ (putative lipid II flippase)
MAKGDEQTGALLFRSLLTWMGSLLILLIVLAEIFALPLARAIAPGFAPDQVDLLAFLLRIVFACAVLLFSLRSV